MRAMMKTAAWILCALSLTSAQDWKKKVDQKQVDAALEKAGEYLHDHPSSRRSLELRLLALLHSGYAGANQEVQDLLKQMLETPIGMTYRASLQAIILVKLDPAKYQSRLAEIAQFLVDSQCRNGQWSYGERLRPSKDVPSEGEKKKDTPTDGSGAQHGDKPKDSPQEPPKHETKALERITIKRKGDGPPTGDNSNSQYAALGLRACHDANIRVPADTITRAKMWWADSQNDDGGWGYEGRGMANSTGSMTMGAIGSVAIYNYIQSGGPGGGAVIDRGKKWIEVNFTVTTNPTNPKKPDRGRSNVGRHFYYLYALERAGIFLNADYFGKNDWYAEGANYLLSTQDKSGTWDRNPGKSGRKVDLVNLEDHCFAILFLRRASQPLRPPVATK